MINNSLTHCEGLLRTVGETSPCYSLTSFRRVLRLQCVQFGDALRRLPACQRSRPRSAAQQGLVRARSRPETSCTPAGGCFTAAVAQLRRVNDPGDAELGGLSRSYATAENLIRSKRPEEASKGRAQVTIAAASKCWLFALVFR